MKEFWKPAHNYPRVNDIFSSASVSSDFTALYKSYFIYFIISFPLTVASDAGFFYITLHLQPVWK